MKLQFIETKTNCPVVIVDEFFSVDDVSEIKKELNHIYSHLIEEEAKYSRLTSGLALSQLAAGSAMNNNVISRKSKSIFLDNLFRVNREDSKILKINRKIFQDRVLLDALIEKSIFYRHIEQSTRDWTLANFYSKGDYYMPHKDYSCFTAITFFGMEKFSGGNFVLPEFDISIESIENRCIIFPGFLEHGAEVINSGNRVSLAQFIDYQ